MRLLILGCGSIGKRHALNATRIVDEVAVYDLDEKQVHSLRNQANVEPFDCLISALAWKPDGVVISTPHSSHVDLAIESLNAGAHVLIEKPISHSITQAKSLLSHSDCLGLSISVVCNMRYHEALLAINNSLHRIGKVLYARAQYGNYLPNMRSDSNYKKLYCSNKESGGGVIFDTIHELDYLMWLFGAVKHVNCISDKLSTLDIDVEDYAEIQLEHYSGVRSSIHVDYLKPFKRRGCEIVGDEGMILWQSEGKAPEHCLVRLFESATNEWINLVDEKALDPNASYERLIQAFVQKIKNPQVASNLSGGVHGFDALKLAHAAHQSSDDGGVQCRLEG